MALFKLGPLSLISSILIVSIALRLAGMASVAFAETETADASYTDTSGSQNVDFQSLLEDFKDREKKLSDQEENFSLRAESLQRFEAELSKQFEQIIAAEKRLLHVMNLADNAAENDVTRLTTVYENMKPKDAANVFEKMDTEFAAGFIARMKAGQAASIMSALQPETAYTISVMLAGRHLD